MPQDTDKKPKNNSTEEEEEKEVKALDEKDINILKRYGMGPYAQKVKKLEEENKEQV